MLACDAVRCGDSVGMVVALTLVPVRVASAGRGGGSILPIGERGIEEPSPVSVSCSFSLLDGRVNLAPAAA